MISRSRRDDQAPDPVSPHWDLPTLHPVYLRLHFQTLRSEGVDVAPLLVDCGLGSWSDLMRRAEPVSYRLVHRLIQQVLALNLRPDLPLELGASVQVSAHGPLGLAVVSSQNLRQALQTLERFTTLRSANFKYRFRERGDVFSFELVDLIGRAKFVPERSFFHTMMFSLIVRMLQAVCGSQLEKFQVEVPIAKPAWHEEFRRIFPGELLFDAPALVVRGSAALLDMPCATADPAAYQQACLECDRLLAQARNSSLRTQIDALLSARSGAYPSLEAVAEFLHMSGRTLARRLAAEGTSFQALLDEIRQRKARWYLVQTSFKVEDIAARLGYGSASSFSRVCKRWFDEYPSEVRQRHALAK